MAYRQVHASQSTQALGRLPAARIFANKSLARNIISDTENKFNERVHDISNGLGTEAQAAAELFNTSPHTLTMWAKRADLPREGRRNGCIPYSALELAKLCTWLYPEDYIPPEMETSGIQRLPTISPEHHELYVDRQTYVPPRFAQDNSISGI